MVNFTEYKTKTGSYSYEAKTTLIYHILIPLCMMSKYPKLQLYWDQYGGFLFPQSFYESRGILANLQENRLARGSIVSWWNLLNTNGAKFVNLDGSFTYDPDADYYGSDSFTYFVSDGTVSVQGTVSIDVTPVPFHHVRLLCFEGFAFPARLPMQCDHASESLPESARGHWFL